MLMHLFWFIHLFGIVMWFGGLVTGGLLLIYIRREVQGDVAQGIPLILRFVTRIVRIGAVFLLVGGISMLFLISHAKLSSVWVQYMFGVGLLVVLTSLFMPSSGRQTKSTDKGSSMAEVDSAVQSYSRWLYPIFVVALSVLTVVSFKL